LFIDLSMLGNARRDRLDADPPAPMASGQTKEWLQRFTAPRREASQPAEMTSPRCCFSSNRQSAPMLAASATWPTLPASEPIGKNRPHYQFSDNDVFSSDFIGRNPSLFRRGLPRREQIW